MSDIPQLPLHERANVRPVRSSLARGRRPHYAEHTEPRTLCDRRVVHNMTDEEAVNEAHQFCKLCVKEAEALAELRAQAATSPLVAAAAALGETVIRADAERDVIRVATRGRGTAGAVTTLHVNCDCLVSSALVGRFSTLEEAEACAHKEVGDTGRTYGRCPRSEPIKALPARAEDRSDPAAPRVRYFDSTGEAYDASQYRDDIRSGDVLVVQSEKVVGVLDKAWPFAVTTAHGDFHTLTVPVRDIDGGRLAASAETAERLARSFGFPLAEPPGSGSGPGKPDPDPFKPGDRVMCADGRVRTVTGMSDRDGSPQVEVKEGPPWPVKYCELVDTSGVPAARERAHQAAARVRVDPDPNDPRWQAALADLTAALRYLRQADPEYAAVLQDEEIGGERVTLRVVYADVLPGDVLHHHGARLHVHDVGFSDARHYGSSQWWADLYGVTSKDRRRTYPYPWRTGLDADLARREQATVERVIPADTPTAEYRAAIQPDPGDSDRCEDWLVIRSDMGAVIGSYTVPHRPGRTADEMLREYGWYALTEWKDVVTVPPANTRRARVQRSRQRPTLTAVPGPRKVLTVPRSEVAEEDVLHDRNARLWVMSVRTERDHAGRHQWTAVLHGVDDEDRRRTGRRPWTLTVDLEDAQRDLVTVERVVRDRTSGESGR